MLLHAVACCSCMRLEQDFVYVCWIKERGVDPYSDSIRSYKSLPHTGAIVQLHGSRPGLSFCFVALLRKCRRCKIHHDPVQ